jgi:ATP-dependent phosphofructokinase / diphosphate-dependent phosphofructokinase
MGRKIGYIPAAARLADPDREMPLEIALAESGISLDQLADNVNERLKSHGRCMVVVSEGFDVGDIGQRKDSFGHTMFGASETTVERVVVNYLNSKKLAARGAARGNTPGTDQRHAIVYASSVDLEEAYKVGWKALELAAAGEGGFMATILRDPGRIYGVRYDKVPLENVANSERTFNKNWITNNGRDVSDDFIRYARPLLGEDMVSIPMIAGRQRLARLKPIFAAKKLPAYTPTGWRVK